MLWCTSPRDRNAPSGATGLRALYLADLVSCREGFGTSTFQGCKWHSLTGRALVAWGWRLSNSCSWEEAHIPDSQELVLCRAWVPHLLWSSYGMKFRMLLLLPGWYVPPLQFVVHLANHQTPVLDTFQGVDILKSEDMVLAFLGVPV